MFTTGEVQAAVDQRASVPHETVLLSPYAFELRPRGFSVSVPNYAVVIDRSNFRMRVGIVTDYLAVAVVATVVAGARNDPARLDRLRSRIRGVGWVPDLRLAEGEFHLAAESREVLQRDESEMIADAIDIGLWLSDYVLAQMIVTKPRGETRPAVERAIGGDSAEELWLFDPSERDRATRVHRSLENWLIETLADAGLQALDPAGAPFFDVSWVTGQGQRHVCEVKSSSTASQSHQLRLGLGQVIEYRHQLASAWQSRVEASLLIESEPQDDAWMKVCADVGVTLFWPARWQEIQSRLTT